MPIDQKMWRTLIRVERVEADDLIVELPASHHGEFRLPISQVPQDILWEIAGGQTRFHVMANWDTDLSKDLKFEKWETR